MKQKKGIPMRDMEKPHFDGRSGRAQTPPRVAARMQPAVRNAGQRKAMKPRAK